MTPKNEAACDTDDVRDIVLHDEIKLRAYQLYERRSDDTGRYERNMELQSELLLVAYAAAQLQKYSNSEAGDSRTVRAARVYLRALRSFIAQA